ncbi:MAG: RlmE family RNA methyltransferase [Pseudomonadota bacterium]
MTRRSKSSDRWLRRQRKDPFASRAQREGQVSRAHFKLAELDERFQLLRPGQCVLELGAAPGGWTRYLEERIGTGGGLLVCCDTRPLTRGPQTRFVQGAYGEPAVDDAVGAALEGRAADLVVSDMAPNFSGIRAADQARAMELAELAEHAARRWLKPGGALLVKLFQGAGVDEWLAALGGDFGKVKRVKPKASRQESRELYAVALEFNSVR